MTETVKPDGKGLRNDAGKPRVDLIPADALLELGRVYDYGARKYAPRNWERGMAWSKMIGPLMRHLFYFMMGQERDEESKQLHIAHVAWNALGLLAFTLRGIGEDDRQKAELGEMTITALGEVCPFCKRIVEPNEKHAVYMNGTCHAYKDPPPPPPPDLEGEYFREGGLKPPPRPDEKTGKVWP